MTSYVLRQDVVRDCLHRLIEQPIHRMFPGYLCLQQESSIKNSLNGLSFPYNEFFEQYLRVKEEDTDDPYFVPFSDLEDPSLESLWLNQNVSGTYAPSSLRTTAPLMQIAEIEQGGHQAKWRLISEHWKSARAELCDGDQVPVESLSAYLLRDYAFTFDEPSAFSLVRAFADEFGYTIGGEAFSHLYRTGDSNITRSSFEEHD